MGLLLAVLTLISISSLAVLQGEKDRVCPPSRYGKQCEYSNIYCGDYARVNAENGSCTCWDSGAPRGVCRPCVRGRWGERCEHKCGNCFHEGRVTWCSVKNGRCTVVMKGYRRPTTCEVGWTDSPGDQGSCNVRSEPIDEDTPKMMADNKRKELSNRIEATDKRDILKKIIHSHVWRHSRYSFLIIPMLFYLFVAVPLMILKTAIYYPTWTHFWLSLLPGWMVWILERSVPSYKEMRRRRKLLLVIIRQKKSKIIEKIREFGLEEDPMTAQRMRTLPTDVVMNDEGLLRFPLRPYNPPWITTRDKTRCLHVDLRCRECRSLQEADQSDDSTLTHTLSTIIFDGYELILCADKFSTYKLCSHMQSDRTQLSLTPQYLVKDTQDSAVDEFDANLNTALASFDHAEDDEEPESEFAPTQVESEVDETAEVAKPRRSPNRNRLSHSRISKKSKRNNRTEVDSMRRMKTSKKLVKKAVSKHEVDGQEKTHSEMKSFAKSHSEIKSRISRRTKIGEADSLRRRKKANPNEEAKKATAVTSPRSEAQAQKSPSVSQNKSRVSQRGSKMEMDSMRRKKRANNKNLSISTRPTKPI